MTPIVVALHMPAQSASQQNRCCGALLQVPFVAVQGLPFKQGRAAASPRPLCGWRKVRVAAALRARATVAASIADGFDLRRRDDGSDATHARRRLAQPLSIFLLRCNSVTKTMLYLVSLVK